MCATNRNLRRHPRRPAKIYACVPTSSCLQRKTIRRARILCIAALVAITAYAFTRLYVFAQRADIWVLVINVGLFAAVAGVLVYLSRKEREIEEGEMFRD